IKAGRLSLHYTDITLAEVNRQLLEEVEEKVARLNKLKRELGRMAQLCDDVPALPDVDKETMGKSVSIGFLDVMVSELSGHPIHAMQISPRRIFDKYFKGLPPFAKRGSKEFPDAFIIEALGEYCAKNDLRMYV
ncbi:PIN domain-containing protein, partial [Mesorhizobium sp. M1A.F.Ca.IN.020.32.1.1]|uniref:PIN domain-containing protein n=1 Tax=Mesorhizobium sp. M1A.F.Ca.IN.020.32.1.1 TaxID=2496763 RepID=UPI0013E3C28F